jgi:hypothetical protein
MSAQAVSDVRQDGPAVQSAFGTWRRRAWIAGYTVAAIGLFFCYLRLSGTQPVTSDGSSMALQAWDMLHGNLLLHGWRVADVTFWTTELPEYMIVQSFQGLGAFDVHIAAAAAYTLLVLLAGLVAKGRATGREGLVRVAIASGIMLAPQLGNGALLLLLSPDHTGTGVPLLAIWLILDRGGRRWWVPPAVAVLLTWTLTGDRVAEVLAVVPLAGVYGFRVLQGLARKTRPWFDAAMAVAAVSAYAASTLIGALIAALGGFRLLPVKLILASPAALPGNLQRTFDGISTLYGANFYQQPFSFQTVLSLVHLAGLGLAVAAAAIGIRRFLRQEDVLVSVLAAGILVNLAVYVLSTMPVGYWSTREIAGVLPAGAVLAGRLLAGPVLRARLSRIIRLRPLLGAVAVVYAVALGYGMAQPQVPAVGQNLADWLSAHHLKNGLTGYGYGPPTTLASGGRVAVRQAVFLPGRAGQGPEEQQRSWYNPSKHKATFLVLAARPDKFVPLTPAVARSIFGRPAYVYRVGRKFWVWTYLEFRSYAAAAAQAVVTARICSGVG